MGLKYRADIDGLRAIAVLLVLVFHFDLLGLGQAGFIGVDVFFVISGYLISSIIWRDLEAGNFRISHFYARRIRRLAPALVAVQLLVLASAALLLLPGEVWDVAKESLAAQLYVSNIYYWKTLNYFGLHADRTFMLHTWSLGVEEQFYLLYPLFLLVVHRFARKFLCAALIVLFLASFTLNILLVSSKPELTFYLLPTRAWELAAGALLAFAEPWFRRNARARRLAGPAGLAMIVAALWLHSPQTPFPGWFALLPVAAASLLLLAGTGESSPVSKLLSKPGVTFFGRISYPLYLIHWPINVFALVLLPTYGLGARWTGFCLSILVAFAITQMIERPIRLGRWLATDTRMVRAYVGALAGIMLLVGSAAATDGWRLRFTQPVLHTADIATDLDADRQTWDHKDSAPMARYLRPIGQEQIAPTWFIYGDSHAGALTGALSLALKSHGEAGEVAYQSGCMPLLDTGSSLCRTFNRQAVEHAAGRKVLLVSIWRQPLEAGYRGQNREVLSGAAAIADYTKAMARTVNALRAAGAEVHVWEPLPSTRYFVPEAMARSMIFGPYWSVGRTLASHRQEMGFVAKALDGAGIPRADRIDPAPALCPSGRCTFALDGLPVYSDNNHPARWTAPWFARIIGGAI